jgi:bifunctional DNase/RNase
VTIAAHTSSSQVEGGGATSARADRTRPRVRRVAVVLVEIELDRVVVRSREEAVMVLRPVSRRARGQELPVWIGAAEAALVAVAQQGRRSTRPLTHDLLEAMLRRFGKTIECATIYAVESGIFLARIEAGDETQVSAFECRPADAVALALRAKAPLRTSPSILERYGRVAEA